MISLKYEEIEKIYSINKLNDFKLQNIEDIKKCHGIDVTNIKGYESLTYKNKEIFKTFIVNIFNAFGLEARNKLKPISISECDEFLKFEYIQWDSERWLHVIDEGKTWY